MPARLHGQAQHMASPTPHCCPPPQSLHHPTPPAGPSPPQSLRWSWACRGRRGSTRTAAPAAGCGGKGGRDGRKDNWRETQTQAGGQLGSLREIRRCRDDQHSSRHYGCPAAPPRCHPAAAPHYPILLPPHPRTQHPPTCIRLPWPSRKYSMGEVSARSAKQLKSASALHHTQAQAGGGQGGGGQERQAGGQTGRWAKRRRRQRGRGVATSGVCA